MNSKLIAVAVIGAAAFTTSLPARADGSFEIVNTNEKATIIKMWTAAYGQPKDPWKEIEIKQPIRPRTTSRFDHSGNICNEDIKVRFDDGYEHTFENVNVCDGPPLFIN
ncbi:MAG: hypothetical protein JO366_05905 [Methylobacteriaceae bacterium]|nr:hypothetical protein [Methylobacteriaceae bacterium]MBV9218463.1 hypothetical protein [Methylobacteriaceae bacterium]MBV9244329.1 hypothetical protein [Methylobacteriaceae bacterium]MBV9633900.1 hypothetical protein [Methylobacteriaceae bacterium]